jgi:hypothetical protein
VFRTCAVVALFLSRMTVALFDLGLPAPPAGVQEHRMDERQPVVELQATVISGLPEDAGTLRR